MVEIGEAINVLVYFKHTKIFPYLFFWGNRRIKVEAINLVHTSKEGGVLFYHFSVSSGASVYFLTFNSKDLTWTLEEVEE